MDEHLDAAAATTQRAEHVAFNASQPSQQDLMGQGMNWPGQANSWQLSLASDLPVPVHPAASRLNSQQRDANLSPLLNLEPNQQRPPPHTSRPLPVPPSMMSPYVRHWRQSETRRHLPEAIDAQGAPSQIVGSAPFPPYTRASVPLPATSHCNVGAYCSLPSHAAYSHPLSNEDVRRPLPPQPIPSPAAPAEVSWDVQQQDYFDSVEYPPEELDTDFKRKYPPDKFGEEAADNARVWKVYRDEATEDDKTLLNAWNKTLDILLIFAGLFSGVSTAFLIESYKLLQPDYTQYLADAVFVALTARDGSNGLDLQRIPLRAPTDFTSSLSAHWVNGLWFTSLALSLSVSLLCILAKQWLDEYHSRVSSPAQSVRYWVRRRAFYYDGIRHWQLHAFIAALPILLHASLFLFLAGLVIFLWQLHLAIAVWLLAWSAVVFVFYVGSIIVPIKHLACPSATPLVRLTANATRQVSSWILRNFRRVFQACVPFVQWLSQRFNIFLDLLDSETDESLSAWLQSVRTRPSATNELELARLTANATRQVLWWILRNFRRALHACVPFVQWLSQRFNIFLDSLETDESLPAWLQSGRTRPSATNEHELALISGCSPQLDAEALAWLIHSSPSSDIVTVAVQAIGAFTPWSGVHMRLSELDIFRAILEHMNERYPDIFIYPTAVAPMPGGPSLAVADGARYIRSMIHVHFWQANNKKYCAYVSSALRCLVASVRRGPWLTTYDMRELCELSLLIAAGSTPDPYRSERPVVPYTWTPNMLLALYLPSCSVRQLLHVFHPDCLERLRTSDLDCLVRRVQAILRYHDVSLCSDTLSSIPACIELWSTILNRRGELSLDFIDVAAAVRTLEKFISYLSTDEFELIHTCYEIWRREAFPQFLRLCASELEKLDVRLTAPSASLFQHLSRWGWIHNSTNAVNPGTKESWLAFVGLVRSGSRISRRSEVSTDSSRIFDDLARIAFSLCGHGRFTTSVQTRYRYDLRHDPLPFTMPLLQRINGGPSAWQILHRGANEDSPSSSGSELRRSQYCCSRADAALVELTSVLAAHLSILHRQGVHVTELVEEFFSVPIHHYLQCIVHSLRDTGDPYALRGGSFGRLAHDCTELSTTWWPELYHLVLTGPLSGDETVTGYARELDKRMRM